MNNYPKLIYVKKIKNLKFTITEATKKITEATKKEKAKTLTVK